MDGKIVSRKTLCTGGMVSYVSGVDSSVYHYGVFFTKLVQLK